MQNPNIQYPGDLGCSYELCPNRREARIKRGTLMPLGEIESFRAGTGIHRACMERILISGNTTLDNLSAISDTIEVAKKEEV